MAGLLAATAVATGIAPVHASIGTGVAVSPVHLAEAARPGSMYKLSGLYVVNTGTEQSAYHVIVQRLATGPERDVPSSWVVIGADVTLQPNVAATVPISLSIPAEAASGDYKTDLVAGTVSPGGAPGAGAALGARAATELTFSVGTADSSALGWPWPRPVVAALAGVAMMGFLVFLLRITGVRFQVERRPSTRASRR